MTSEDLRTLIAHPEQTSRFADELRRITTDYPYFHTAQSLLLQAIRANDDDAMQHQLELSAICVRDRSLLYHYLHDPQTFDKRTGQIKPAEQILDAFLAAPPQKIVVRKTNYEVQIKDELPENKVIATETLAEVFAKQGIFDKAIEIYQQLILKNPEKSSYFAAKIKSLKN